MKVSYAILGDLTYDSSVFGDLVLLSTLFYCGTKWARTVAVLQLWSSWLGFFTPGTTFSLTVCIMNGTFHSKIIAITGLSTPMVSPSAPMVPIVAICPRLCNTW
jgi:hypothetical protein